MRGPTLCPCKDSAGGTGSKTGLKPVISNLNNKAYVRGLGSNKVLILTSVKHSYEEAIYDLFSPNE